MGIDISTHAPREGSDREGHCPQPDRRDFNPRSPRGERRGWHALLYAEILFQPTLPARGATFAASVARTTGVFQPTLPARGATCFHSALSRMSAISTHAPREGSDSIGLPRDILSPPISTHAPREGSDRQDLVCLFLLLQISTHAPREGSDPMAGPMCRRIRISTHAPREGSDTRQHTSVRMCVISTHAPREGSDRTADDLDAL